MSTRLVTMAAVIIVIGIARVFAGSQYMALCTETQEHGGREYALTAWITSFDGANEAGKAHEQATRGHRWRVATRESR